MRARNENVPCPIVTEEFKKVCLVGHHQFAELCTQQQQHNQRVKSKLSVDMFNNNELK